MPAVTPPEKEFPASEERAAALETPLVGETNGGKEGVASNVAAGVSIDVGDVEAEAVEERESTLDAERVWLAVTVDVRAEDGEGERVHDEYIDLDDVPLMLMLHMLVYDADSKGDEEGDAACDCDGDCEGDGDGDSMAIAQETLGLLLAVVLDIPIANCETTIS